MYLVNLSLPLLLKEISSCWECQLLLSKQFSCWYKHSKGNYLVWQQSMPIF